MKVNEARTVVDDQHRTGYCPNEYLAEHVEQGDASWVAVRCFHYLDPLRYARLEPAH